MKAFNCYLTGVGGQGIGLLSEILLRAADHAGWTVRGVDTHGLAQRGGIVVSRIRFGDGVHAPLIASGGADLVVALERHEALRGMIGYLKPGGTLAYYDAVWQPLEVRLGTGPEVSDAVIREQAARMNVRVVTVFKSDLADARMQNIVLLAHLDKHRLVPGVGTVHFKQAMDDLMSGSMHQKNVALFDSVQKALDARNAAAGRSGDPRRSGTGQRRRS